MLAILLVAVLCCGFVPQHRASRNATTPTKSNSELHTEALKSLLIKRDTALAANTLSALLKQDSTYAPALHLFARITSDKKRAVEYARRAYLSDTTNRFYLKVYGRALLQNEEYDEAVTLFRKMVKRSNDPEDFYILSILLEASARTKEALSVVDTAIVRFGPAQWTTDRRLQYLMRLGEVQIAESEAKKAVEEAPYSSDNHLALAKIYAITKRDSLAIRSFSQAILVDTAAVEPKLELARFCKKRGQTTLYLLLMQDIFEHKEVPLEDKINEWKSLTQDMKSYAQHLNNYDAIISGLHRSYPDSREVRNLYAVHLVRVGRREEALNIYKQLLNQKKPSVEDFFSVIELEEFLGQKDSAYYHNAQALAHYPENLYLRMTMGVMEWKKKEYSEALEIFNTSLKYTQNPTELSQIWGIIGDIELDRNEMKRSFKAYEKALKYNPDNESVLNNYAYNLSLKELDLERALEMITRAISLEKGNATYLDTMAWVLYKLGRYAEAKRYMQQALSLDRDNSSTLALHYGDILEALGESFMAKTYWQKALERKPDADEKREIEERLSRGESKPKTQKR